MSNISNIGYIWRIKLWEYFSMIHNVSILKYYVLTRKYQ